MKHNSKIYNLIFSLIGLWLPFISIAFTFSHMFRDVLGYFFLMILIFLFSHLFKKKITYTLWIFFSSLIFSLIAFIDIAHFSVFKYTITPSTMYIVMESNTYESTEFLSVFLSPKIISLGLLHFLSVIFGVAFSFLQFSSIIQLRTFKLFKAYSILALFFTCSIIFVNNRRYFTPYIALKSVFLFQKERKEISEMAITEKGDFENVSQSITDEKETYVIIIGESTTRTHMGLYGYYRQTNPLLSKRSNELLIYENVRSPHTHTITSLGKSLTLGEYDNPLKKFNSTLVQLFNSANFYTYFISNQKPIGQYETTVTLISKKSDKSIFTHLPTAIYDEAIIKPLQQILKEDSRKKIIMIHLMGTHLAYANRYPSKYDVFKDKPLTKFDHERAFRTINEYDNAVLYNDYIVNNIIDEVKNDNSKSYVLYFSDHGEDVFETIDEACHTELKATEPMYQIPFTLWMSKKYKSEETSLVWNTKRRYNLENLIHTVADLSNIKFDRFEAHKSIVNPRFPE